MKSDPGIGRILRIALGLAILSVVLLGTFGRFRSAAALTLGAVVAIVSARWLSFVVGRLLATRAGEGRRFGWKFGFGAGLRYLFVGLAVYGAVSLVPSEPVWLVVGLSTVVLAVVIDGLGSLARLWLGKVERLKRNDRPGDQKEPGRSGGGEDQTA